ncbi:unnamed protein product [Linum tenue]|uniref:Uncharacterized protein n=1 Tax=Linum tenue TaxID=586396 RepID=A0AAV0IEQ3_9ROSI|nr:unnamed protein product [Linum tenue]
MVPLRITTLSTSSSKKEGPRCGLQGHWKSKSRTC